MYSLPLKIIAVLQFIYFYQEGGQGHRFTKKWLGPSLLATLLLVILSMDGKLGILSGLSAFGYLGASNSFAYGDKFTQGKLGKKILFRGLCGAMYGLCGLLLGIGTGHWILGACQLLLATAASILFGCLNPFPSAQGNFATREEDICIALGYISLLPFIV